MIKSLSTAAYLILGSNVFSFYKMEEIYYDPSSSPYFNKEEAKVFRFESWEKLTHKPGDTMSLFLYDKNTFTQFHCMFTLPASKSDTETEEVNNNKLNFLNCNPANKLDFFNANSLINSITETLNMHPLFYRKQPLIFNSEGSIERKDTEDFFKKISSLCNYSYQQGTIPYLYLGEKKSFSNVLMSEFKKGVNLSTPTNKEGVDMTQALKDYFVKAVNQNELGDNINKPSDNNLEKGSLERELESSSDFDKYKTLNAKNYDLLQNSTILKIWCLIPQKRLDERNEIKTVESEMIGLARDERTGELYHWTTDLGQDISVLMNYRPKKTPIMQ